MVYADRIKALANCPTWAKQVENVDLQSSSSAFFYVIVREGMNKTTNMELVVKTIDSHVNNICISQGQIALANLLELHEVDFVLFYFLSHFYFIFDLFSIFELKVKV